MSQWSLSDFRCSDCGDFEALVERPVPDTLACSTCGLQADWIISAPMPLKDSVPCTAVTRGGDMKERPPGMLDTRPLAEGMPMSEWKKVQRKHTEERRHQQMIKNGLKTKRIQSP